VVYSELITLYLQIFIQLRRMQLLLQHIFPARTRSFGTLDSAPTEPHKMEATTEDVRRHDTTATPHDPLHVCESGLAVD
jgi:hypothetical protein